MYNLFIYLDKINLEQNALKTKALTLLLKLMLHLFNSKSFSTLKATLKEDQINCLLDETMKIVDCFIRTCYM